ncbi:MAG: DUF4294 domain-containing protein [Bacteroidales bacterium]|nr:DUF4294 domain-containing protein [Bacteroidales bacterium]
MKSKRYSIYFVVCMLFCMANIDMYAQKFFAKPRIVCRAVVLENNDTIPCITLKEVRIISSGNLLTPEEIRKNKKLIRNAKIVLPYAKMAKNKLYELNNRMLEMPERERKAFMKTAEKEIEQEYAEKLKKLTFSQGNLLIKLVDRETGSSSYTLVKELRGSFRAFFYQAFAKVFGYDLKAEFDPVNNKKDNLIDRVVKAIELNQI